MVFEVVTFTVSYSYTINRLWNENIEESGWLLVENRPATYFLFMNFGRKINTKGTLTKTAFFIHVQCLIFSKSNLTFHLSAIIRFITVFGWWKSAYNTAPDGLFICFKTLFIVTERKIWNQFDFQTPDGKIMWWKISSEIREKFIRAICERTPDPMDFT